MPFPSSNRLLLSRLRWHQSPVFISYRTLDQVFFVCLYLCIRKILDHKYHPSARLLWIALGLLAVNFVVKNLALVCFHVDLLQIF